MAVLSILGGDIELHDFDENNQGRIVWAGAATGTRTLNETYSAILKEMDEAGNMDQGVPIEAVTPTQYRLINQWFIDDDTVEHLTGGSLFSLGWVSGTDEHVLIIGADFATAFTVHDIGRTIVGGTTGDTGTLLDFNSARGLLWIRPDDPSNTGDEFDNPSEAYSIQNDTAAQVWQEDNDGGPSYVDMTTEFNDATDNNIIPFPATEAANDAFHIGFAQPFSKLIFDYANGVAGVGGTVAWEYYNGSGWTDLSETDNTNGFTAAVADGLTVEWAAPSNWAKTSINGSAQLYYVRARITGTYSTNPQLDQGFIAGQGAGNFQEHARHGGGSAAGESGWAGITSIGAIQDNTKAYIFQEDPDTPAGSFKEKKVVATKGTDSWWPQSGQLDIVLKTKEANSIFGPNPDSATNGIATFLMRQYSKTYSHFIATSLATAGGETVVPFSTGDDLDNTTGHRQFTTDAETGGGWGPSDVDTVIREQGNNNNTAVITSISGTGPNYTVQYYLIGTQEDFINNDIVEDTGATKSMTLDSNGVDAGPASLAVNPVFGATTQDINNGNGARPYCIRFDPASNPLADIYERMKYLTRRGSVAVLQGQDGEEYVGPELQLEYTGQAGGNFVEGAKVYDQTTDAEGIIVGDHDDGATGDVILKAVRGTFGTNVLSDSPDPTQTLGAALQVDASPFAIVDETTDAQSAGGADVDPFPAVEAVGDYFVIGAAKPFASVAIDIATSGVGGVGLWEYWDGSAWQDLEAVSGFSDGTSDLTAGTGVQTLSFYPPLDWEKHTLIDGAVSYGPLYMIRLRVTTVYSTNPVLDEVTIADFVTATIASTRTIVPIPASPFGTFAGGKFFGAPGVTLTTANLAAGEDQSYQLIDDNGVTQIPPNTITFEVDNLIAGDFVAVYRRTGSDINKTQFSLAAGNNLGDVDIVMSTTIPTDNPTNANSKVRILSLSGEEHRYRYSSYASATFTLATASTGTDGGTGTLTTIVDGSATFITDGVEPGDMVRNTTDGVSYSEVVSVDSENQLTVTDNGQTWASQAYSVNTLVENYNSGQNAYVPIIERLADATSESNKLVLATNIDARVVVRRSSAATEIEPFTSDITISGSQTTTTIRNDDTIIT